MSSDETPELIEARKNLERLRLEARKTFNANRRAECAVRDTEREIEQMEFARIGIKGRRKFTYHHSHDGYAAGTPNQIETEWELTTENKWILIAVGGVPVANAWNTLNR